MSKKLTKKINSETKTFWDSTRDARVKVEQWPSWKRNLKVTQFSKAEKEKPHKANCIGRLTR